MFRITRLAAIGLSCALAVVASPTMGAAVSDDFNSGTPGAALNGRVTPVGNATWYASGIYTMSNPIGSVSGGPTLIPGQPVTRMAVVPYVPPTNSITVLEADLVCPNNGPGYWAALVFVHNPQAYDSAFWGEGNGTLFLTNMGDWTVYGNGNVQPLATGHIDGFNGTASHHASLSYDSLMHRLSASVDGVVLASDLALGFTPNITHAGVQFYGNGYPVMDNFSVPEPASLAMLALGGLALVRRRR